MNSSTVLRLHQDTIRMHRFQLSSSYAEGNISVEDVHGLQWASYLSPGWLDIWGTVLYPWLHLQHNHKLQNAVGIQQVFVE